MFMGITKTSTFVKHNYRIYVIAEQWYNNVIKIINGLGCVKFEDSRRGTHLTVLYKIVNHEENVLSEYIIISWGDNSFVSFS